MQHPACSKHPTTTPTPYSKIGTTYYVHRMHTMHTSRRTRQFQIPCTLNRIEGITAMMSKTSTISNSNSHRHMFAP